jgi:hypothetical protein
MNTSEVIALENIITTAKTLAVEGGLLQEQILLVEQWLWSNYCKECKNDTTGGICACDVPF